MGEKEDWVAEVAEAQIRVTEANKVLAAVMREADKVMDELREILKGQGQNGRGE